MPVKLAYGAVVFTVLQDQVSFVTAKTRVAPLKQLTLPWLELMAALIATRLTCFVQKAILLHDPPTYLYLVRQPDCAQLPQNKEVTHGIYS